ncbi:carbohydrate ABC transporter membrane protein 1, CUT1 family [Arthrobacter alpinus]|uniref:Carbohydrate ABC transporter membrane protein 1, CUT1 family n=2 Tax=Arthrobacter alpinus TaxID=656366 RepID=A0A0U3RCD3_9MICC|nr:sugar ABC transporter permease [Arthrobacter alpinus]ALV46828.1 sugar ABC transporter permease [Arthrobacter alpinus]SEE93093.1 carbohydrate ABC transporter membrane protein 1, CUT1 family [Arthrobacter alpinus]
MTQVTNEVQSGSGVVATARRRRKKLTFDKVSFMAVFLGLPLAIYLVFVISPFAQAVYYSMTSWGGFDNNMPFVGFDNYVKLFKDDIFMLSVRNSVVLAVFLPVVTVILSLILATLVTIGGSSRGQIKGMKGAGFYRVISFFPYVIPAVVIGIIWQQIFNPSNGLLNGILMAIGFDGVKDFPWLGDARTALIASMFVIVWGFVGFYMILFIAAIKGIPAETFEAARIDGAGRFRTAISITIPLIRDNIQTAYVYMGILALDAFVYMSILNSTGGPENSTLVMSQKLFTTAFSKGQFGLACAMGVVLAVITLLFSALVFMVNRLTGGSKDVSE